MRVLLFLGVFLLFTLAFADHEEDDHDDHKDDDDRHKSLSIYKLAPYSSKFAIDLYKQVALDHPSGNILISPVSISTAFAFLSLGAKAHTHSEIIQGLGFNSSEISDQEIHEGFHHLLDLMNDDDRELQLSGGNALFLSEEHKILQTFLNEAKRIYHSEALSTDFTDTEEATNQINSYVEKHTNGKIPKLLDSVDQDAIFVLINYIYFRGQWEHPFDEQFTQEGEFHVDDSKTVKVPFMTRTGMYKAAICDDLSVIIIPYKEDITALFILPKLGKISELEQRLSIEDSNKWRKLMQMQFIEVSLPKFSISSTINLKETLSKLGINDVFSDNADLSGVTKDANVKISEALHKAMIIVDERGKEASDSSSVEGVQTMLPPSIKFDRPFVFALHDRKTRSVLFAGRVVNPQE